MKNIRFAVEKRNFHVMAYNEVHPEIELYYLKSGERLYFVENRTYHLTAGSSILVSSNRIHKTSSIGAQPHERMLLQFHPDYLDELSAMYPGTKFDYLLSQSAVITTPDHPLSGVIAKLFEETERLQKEKPFGWEDEIRCNVFKLLVNFHRSLSGSAAEHVIQSSKHQKIYEVVEYIAANMSTITSLDALCNHFFISKYYLCHSFKEVTGLSVMAFLNMTRVLRACVLLRDSDMPMPQIAKAVGFSSVPHFTDVFKRIEDVTPHEYRRLKGKKPLKGKNGKLDSGELAQDSGEQA